MSLHLIDLICPMSPGEGRHDRGVAGYAIDLRYVRSGTPLVPIGWSLVRDHAQNARFILSGPLQSMATSIEQVVDGDPVLGSREHDRRASDAVVGEAKRSYRLGNQLSRSALGRHLPAAGHGRWGESQIDVRNDDAIRSALFAAVDHV